MALRTRPYSDLEQLISARAGASLNDTALSRINALANSAAQIATSASPYWPRLLVLEERTVTNGYVDYEEAGKETIDEVHAVWSGEKWAGASPSSINFYPDSTGIRLTNSDSDTVYVAYKKVLTDKYGDGTDGTVSDVPAEWFEFMAYHAAFSYQVAERVGIDQMNIAYRDVQGRLDDELLKLSRQGIWRTIANQVQNYYNFDSSVN